MTKNLRYHTVNRNLHYLGINHGRLSFNFSDKTKICHAPFDLATEHDGRAETTFVEHVT